MYVEYLGFQYLYKFTFSRINSLKRSEERKIAQWLYNESVWDMYNKNTLLFYWNSRGILKRLWGCLINSPLCWHVRLGKPLVSIKTTGEMNKKIRHKKVINDGCTVTSSYSKSNNEAIFSSFSKYHIFIYKLLSKCAPFINAYE